MIEIYCLRCRAKRPVTVFVKKEYAPLGVSHYGVRGTCPVCRAAVSKMLKKADYDALH